MSSSSRKSCYKNKIFDCHHNKECGHYTWWSLITRAREKNIGWRIDYFCFSKGLRPILKGSYILSGVMGSDHCPIGIIIVSSHGQGKELAVLPG